MNAPEQSSQQAIAHRSGWLKHVVALVFGVALLWFAFRGCNFAEIWNYAKGVNPFYLSLIFLSGIASHFLRAWRWIFLVFLR